MGFSRFLTSGKGTILDTSLDLEVVTGTSATARDIGLFEFDNRLLQIYESRRTNTCDACAHRLLGNLLDE
ncbi:hypothetical protein [Desulfovibrio ferrophilus]|uniref:PAS domain containing protein n=1 Tax=Desulfovibrio ferrophilus TaxID=241368 RepID=A0A2Z6AWS9_9BACT|nr:hypothetical protein [Desulfovibrio ferrophilus]BBD07653.1 PAS domain containing protein [Desulfovibrio ferrophilus]